MRGTQTAQLVDFGPLASFRRRSEIGNCTLTSLAQISPPKKVENQPGCSLAIRYITSRAPNRRKEDGARAMAEGADGVILAFLGHQRCYSSVCAAAEGIAILFLVRDPLRWRGGGKLLERSNIGFEESFSCYKLTAVHFFVLSSLALLALREGKSRRTSPKT
ncbi:hypothetical protein LZ31DRAFT_32056 [Colletotrichum somersetense]|nr:hypothetical protein LZ31DRAFT_32056 [Colletotrichum somersetense]